MNPRRCDVSLVFSRKIAPRIVNIHFDAFLFKTATYAKGAKKMLDKPLRSFLN